MSILFIGQRHPIYYSPQINQPKLPQHLRQKRLQQQRYRQDLLTQIMEKKERKKIQKQEEEEYYLKIQASLSRDKHLKKDNPQVGFISTFSKPGLGKREENPTSFQSFNTILSPNNRDYQPLNIHNNFRFKTQNTSSKSVFEEFMESREKRQEQLREYEDKKFGEVYEKLHGSLEESNSEDYYGVIKSRFKPIRLSIPNKYKRRQLHLNRQRLFPWREEEANPEEDDFYKLPPIIKKNKEDSKWREWFARQKLRQLEDYYSKTLIDRQVVQQSANASRLHTPAYPNEQRNN